MINKSDDDNNDLKTPKVRVIFEKQETKGKFREENDQINIETENDEINEDELEKSMNADNNDLSKLISTISKVDNKDPFLEKCEFCETTFHTKNNLGLKKRYHIYSHHFNKEINDAIDWKSSGKVCPVENCTFSATKRGNMIHHYIGAAHGVLDKYIDAAKCKKLTQNDTSSVDLDKKEIKGNESNSQYNDVDEIEFDERFGSYFLPTEILPSNEEIRKCYELKKEFFLERQWQLKTSQQGKTAPDHIIQVEKENVTDLIIEDIAKQLIKIWKKVEIPILDLEKVVNIVKTRVNMQTTKKHVLEKPCLISKCR